MHFQRPTLVASWLVHSTGTNQSGFKLWSGTLCCVFGQDTLLSVSLSTQVYKWVPANLALVVTLKYDRHPIQGGVEIPLDGSCYRNWDEH